jgi:hypothetical protein
MATPNSLKTNMGALPVTPRAAKPVAPKIPAKVEPKIPAKVEPKATTPDVSFPYYDPVGVAQEAAATKAKEVEELKAKQKELTSDVLTAYDKELAEKIKPKEEQLTFKPDREYMTNVANMFMLVGMLGSFIGGKGSVNAAANAQAALTGMMNGLVKGSDAEYNRQKSIFDENAKYLTKQIEDQKAIFKEMKENLIKNGIAQGSSEAAEKFRLGGHDLAAAMTAKVGLDAAYEKSKGAFEAGTKLYDLKDKHDKREQDLRRENAELGIRRQEFDLRKEEWEYKLAHPETMSGRGGAQQQGMSQRAINSLGGVASAAESLMRLPAGTTTGFLPNLQTKDGMLNAIRNQMGRTVTSPQAEIMNTLFTGIGRNLASIEASGAATGLQSLANQMQSGVYIQAGVDDPYKVAIKLADIRRIATENIQPAIDSGLLTAKQTKTAQDLVDRIKRAIPYDTLDVVNAYNRSLGGPQTIGEQTGGIMIPDEAIKMLKSDPNLASDFDAQFGAGSAQRVLGR